ncbi:MAG TPA: protein kinase [Blastocatellia bacterium]|nr:protein kinase [Blastocatellia bacterium]
MKEWLPAGTVIAHFQISSRISANGIGEVYQATDISSKSSGLEMALKLLPASLIDDPQTGRRFIQTFSTIAQMRHHNFCRVYEAGITDDGRPFVATEYVKGQSLDLVSLNYSLSIPEIILIIIQTAEALEVLHSQGWIHLTIKPANLMMTSDRQVKILDLGVGSVFSLQMVGEQPDLRSDIFSLGAVFYELLTGHPPFSGSSAPGVVVAATLAEPPPIMDFREDASSALNEVVMRALAKDPGARYQTMSALARDLRSLLGPELARDPKRAAWASDSLGARKSSGIDGEDLPPGSLMDDLKQALEGLLAGKPRARAALQPKIQLEPERSFLADIAHFCRLYWRYLLASFLFFAGLATAVAIVTALRGEEPETEATRLSQTTSLTTSGKVRSATISPDGERLIYAVDEGWGQSLLLKELKSAKETRVAAAQSIEYRGLTFSRDGRWINYLKTPVDSGAGAVFRIAAHGGTEQPLPIANAISSVSFSPDERSLAAIRTDDAGSKTSLWVGNENGEGVDLSVRSRPAAFQSAAPAWSPDGRVIVCAVRDSESDLFLKLVAIGVEDRNENTIVSGRWSEIDRLAWRADGGGLIIAASDPIARRSQLWRVDYPSGDVSRLTRDWGDYRDASLTRDDSLLIAVQSEVFSNVRVARGTDADQARQITTGRLDGVNGIAWTPDGRLVYVSLTNGREGVWIGSDGGDGAGEELRHRSLPTESGDGGQYQPTVSPDGRFITYVIERASGTYLTRNEIERREFNSLANERLAFYPQFAPDGKWIIYSTIRDGRGSIARIPSGGGSPIIMIGGRAWRAVVSPDGTKIACNYLDETSASWRLAVLPVSGGAPAAVFDAPYSLNRVVQWTPDGERLAFVVTRGGVSNIWSQPVSGGTPTQLTNFKSDRIFNFAWSRGGKRLALAQGWVSSDVALIQNFR